jgi:translation initiation factor IF-2
VEIDTKDGKKKITFIDTPGHETFTKIRSRGAEVADIAILVVAVNDGIQPQTIESIELIKQAKIPFIVAITKIDLGLRQETIKKKLAKFDVLVEEEGGNVVCVGVSSKTKEGIKDLLEMIVLLSEMKELSFDPLAKPSAVVIESKVDKRKGVEVGAIVKNGILKVGQEIFTETQEGKIRAIFTDWGESVAEAGPSFPCKILGFSKPPMVGEIIVSEEIQKDIEKDRAMKTSDQNEQGENIFKIILKADSQNSLEAITYSLPQDGLRIISSGLGEISEADVFLAKTTKAFIIGFGVQPSFGAAQIAQSERVRIKIYKIIYELLEEIQDVVRGIAEKDFQQVLGKATIVNEFPFDKKRIAGIKVIEGRIARGDVVLIKRKEEDIGRGIVKTMRRFKEEINKTEVGNDCGILIDPSIDFKVDDMIVSVQS